MRSRQILGIAIFCGALSTLGGQTVQAQTPNSARFVSLLLINETALINADTKAIARQDSLIAKLDSATSTGQAKSIGRSLSRLNARIVAMTAKLILHSTQAYTTAVNLKPSNPGLVSQALAALKTVQQIAARVGLGLAPVSASS